MKYTKTIGLVLLTCLLTIGAVIAYNNGARNSLLKSRDQVSDQRYQLQQAYNDVDRKISDLQRQKYSISRYLTDCDRSLRDIDRALSAQDQGY